VPEIRAIRARHYSLRSTLERMRRFWVCCRQPFPYRITEGLPVVRELHASALSEKVKHRIQNRPDERDALLVCNAIRFNLN
jgi:hypothetical protein